MLPAWKRTFFSSSSLPLSDPPPSTSQSSHHGSLSREALPVCARTPTRRKRPPPGGGGRGDGPRGGGPTTREQACIIKTGQAANQSPRIHFMNLARGSTTDQNPQKESDAPLCLFVYYLGNIPLPWRRFGKRENFEKKQTFPWAGISDGLRRRSQMIPADMLT